MNHGPIEGANIYSEPTGRSEIEEELRYLYDVTPPPDWADGGAVCLQIPAFIELEEDQQTSVCVGCPMQAACAEYGKANDLEGIWGGLNQERRRAGEAIPSKVAREQEAAQAIPAPSQVKGVSWSPRENAWGVRVQEVGARRFGGYHKELGEAEHVATELRATMKGEAMQLTGQIKCYPLYGNETAEWVDLDTASGLSVEAPIVDPDEDVVDEALQARFEKLCSPVTISVKVDSE